MLQTSVLSMTMNVLDQMRRPGLDTVFKMNLMYALHIIMKSATSNFLKFPWIISSSHLALFAIFPAMASWFDVIHECDSWVFHHDYTLTLNFPLSSSMKYVSVSRL